MTASPVITRVDTAPEVRAATRAVYTVFILLGLAGASWAARIPQVRDELGLTPSRLGVVLLAIAAGSVVSLPLAGQVVAHFGSRRTVAMMAGLLAASLGGAAIGYQFGVLPLFVALFFFGIANGSWDVAMNVQGAIVEGRLGRAIMPRFHAGFSVGTVAGALVGAGMVALHVNVTWHLLITGVLVGIVVILTVSDFLPDTESTAEESKGVGSAGVGSAGVGSAGVGSAGVGPGNAENPAAVNGGAGNTGVGNGGVGNGGAGNGGAGNAAVGNGGAGEGNPAAGGWQRTLAAWREPRTLLIGVFVLAFALTEGAGMDWIAVAMIDDYDVAATTGTLAFALFLAAMTGGRWFGPGLLDRFGRVVVLRALAVVSLAGLAVFIFSPWVWAAYFGVLLWGLGASLGFPVGMSAAADDPAHAAPRVSVVASIGYLAFLGGPPVIGFLGDHSTVLRALLLVAVLLVIGILLAGSVRPLRPASLHDEPAGRLE